MLTHETEREVLKRAAEAFRRTAGIGVRVDALGTRRGRTRADAKLHFQFPRGGRRFYAEVKRMVTPQNLGQAIDQIRRLPGQTLLVTEYMNPNMAERLRQMDVPFLDTVGNAYVNAPPAFVYIKGQVPQRFPRVGPTRAFAPAGLKVVFALLCRQELAGAQTRIIAATAHVALGTVAWVIDDLTRLGHILRMGRLGRKLTRKRQLLDRWVGAFPDQLRAKLVLGRYTAPHPEWWKQARLAGFDACWGGELAAARLTGYLKPELVTVYVRGEAGKFLAANQLRTDHNGNVEVLDAFWDKALDWTNREIAHPLLIYADLLRTGDPRNLETAKQIYDEQLAGLVGED